MLHQVALQRLEQARVECILTLPGASQFWSTHFGIQVSLARSLVISHHIAHDLEQDAVASESVVNAIAQGSGVAVSALKIVRWFLFCNDVLFDI